MNLVYLIIYALYGNENLPQFISPTNISLPFMTQSSEKRLKIRLKNARTVSTMMGQSFNGYPNKV